MKKRTRVMIGVPGFMGIQPEAQEGMLALAYRIGRDMPDIELAFPVKYKSEQYRARNSLLDGAIAADFDWMLMLDDDMIVPHNLLARLMSHDKDVVGALYYQRGGGFEPVLMRRHSSEPGDYRASFINLQDPILTSDRGLHKVDVIGGGCMLFKADVFKSLMQPYFIPESQGYGTDISICGRLQDAGYEIWVDTTLELGHLADRRVITSRSIPQADRAMAKVNIQLQEDLKGYLGEYDESLVSKMQQAAAKEQRQDHWEADPDNWDEVKTHYQQDPQWHVLNLAYFNLFKHDPHKEWAMIQGLNLLNPGSHVLDYGSGLGHISIPYAQAGHYVECLDVAGSPTLEFVKWRAKRHNLDSRFKWWELETEFPPTESDCPLDGAFCISVMDHLTKPYDVVHWIYNQLKPGAFFVCEWAMQSDESEPQHLDRYDVTTFAAWMHEIGFATSPEHNWLFFKE